MQQLYAVLSRPAWPISVRQLPGRAAGNDAASQVGLFQHLRDVELDTNHCDPAQHLLRAQAGAPFTTRTLHPRALPRSAPGAFVAAPADAPLAELDELVSAPGS